MRSRIVHLALLAASTACASRPAVRSTGAAGEPTYDPAASGDQRVDVDQPTADSECRGPRPSTRLHVGFPKPLKGASESIASEVPHVLQLIEAQLCHLTPEQDPEGSLRTALGAGLRVDVIALDFTRKDGSRADVRVQLVSAASTDPGGSHGRADGAALVEPPHWRIVLVRAKGAAWRIASAAPR